MFSSYPCARTCFLRSNVAINCNAQPISRFLPMGREPPQPIRVFPWISRVSARPISVFLRIVCDWKPPIRPSSSIDRKRITK